jgi:hypothetical protein
MTTTDAFSAADSDATTSGDDLSTSTEYKYAQVVVPSFELDVASSTLSAANTANLSGNSFIRLGSSPVSVSSGTVTTAGDAPDGFTSSYALAKLVGNMASSSTTVTTAEANADDTTTDVYTENPFNGDKLLGFADDTRIRDDASSSILQVSGSSTLKTNSIANRRAETERLLTKGGWWDHADGNRISTTSGDKIEVIQGNYKMVVLGRRAATDTSDAKIVDISGGYEFSKTYEYVEDDKIWATYEESSAKHATKVTSGKEVTYFTGTLKKTVTGKDPDGIDVTKPKSWIKNPDDDADPEVVTKTWATKIETYVGSGNKPVPHVFSIAYSLTREEITISTEILIVRAAVANFTQVSSGATIIDAKLAATLLFAMNAAPLLVKVDAAAQQFEFKIGSSATMRNFHNNTDAVKNDLTAINNRINGAWNNVCTTMGQIATGAVQATANSLSLMTQGMQLSGMNAMFGGGHFIG